MKRRSFIGLELNPEWRAVFASHYSAIAAAFGIIAVVFVPELLFLCTGFDVNPIARLGWAAGILMVVMVSKAVIQTERHKTLRHVLFGLALLGFTSCTVAASASPHYVDVASSEAFDEAAFAFISVKEGKVLDRGGFHIAYLDTVGVPTIGYGSTRGVRMGMRMHEDEAKALLIQEIAEYRSGFHGALTLNTLNTSLPLRRDVAGTSLTYNIGIGAATRSTFVRRLNKGDIEGACDALTWFNKGGGRVILGLVRRRSEERLECLAGL